MLSNVTSYFVFSILIVNSYFVEPSYSVLFKFKACYVRLKEGYLGLKSPELGIKWRDRKATEIKIE